jgi:hypothetical protein
LLDPVGLLDDVSDDEDFPLDVAPVLSPDFSPDFSDDFSDDFSPGCSPDFAETGLDTRESFR